MQGSEQLEGVKVSNQKETLKAYEQIPYALIQDEVENYNDFKNELAEILGYYKMYKDGASFNTEGSNSEYVAANLHYKMVFSLINKEARFLFAEPPTILVETKGDVGQASDETKNAITTLNDLVKTILDKNKFEDKLLKAAKDCFIGKRVAIMVNWNEEDGVILSFLPSTKFVYETKLGNENILEKFVAFVTVKESISLRDKRIFKKKYTLENGKVYLEEGLYDGAGLLIEQTTDKMELLIDFIPVVICLNDGLVDDMDGESEAQGLSDYEKWYSKLSNSDIDSGRRNMNAITYTQDMDSNSTKNLKKAPGAHWDLGSDQNLPNAHPAAGIIESSMSYSEPLKKTLDRIKSTAFDQLDIPDISLENMQGAITSGKGLKAIYWGLIVRCKEKMKMWGPQLSSMIDMIIKGCMIYQEIASKYTDAPLSQVNYEIKVEQNLPLPEDEAEKKTLMLAEVNGQVISRKKYMKDNYELTDDEVQAELEQIAMENELINTSSSLVPPTDRSDVEPYNNEDDDVEVNHEPLDGPEDEPKKEATMYQITSVLNKYSRGQLTYNNAIRMFAKIGVDADEAKELLEDNEVQQ